MVGGNADTNDELHSTLVYVNSSASLLGIEPYVRRKAMADDDSPADGENPMAGLAESWTASLEGRTKLDRLAELLPELREPTKATTIADRADCSTNFARSKLDMFAELGVLERVSEDPVTYQRNERHFERLRVESLLEEHGDELEAVCARYEERDEKFQEYFGVESPDVASYALDADGGSIDDFEADAERLDEWYVVRDRLVALRKAKVLDRIQRDDTRSRDAGDAERGTMI